MKSKLLFAIYSLCLVSLSVQATQGKFSGCTDPDYITYVDKRLQYYTEIEQKWMHEADEEVAGKALSELSSREQRNYLHDVIIHKAQFESFETASVFIHAFENQTSIADEVTAQHNIQGVQSTVLKWLASFFDPFVMDGDFKHRLHIAKGWLALRQGNDAQAVAYALQAADTNSSPVLSSFGPDMSLIRALYKLGYNEAVLEYLTLAEKYWDGEFQSLQIAIWREMINQNCPMQFHFYDVTDTRGFALRKPFADAIDEYLKKLSKSASKD